MKKIINLLLISFIAAGLTACWSEDIPEAGAARHQVTDLTATPGDEEVLLSWSLPEGWNPTDFIVYYTDADSETVTLRTGGEMNCFYFRAGTAFKEIYKQCNPVARYG